MINFIVEACISGVFGNKADLAVGKLRTWYYDYYKGNRYKNHDLQRATLSCYYQAVIRILEECKDHDSDFSNLEWYEKQIKDRNSSNKKLKSDVPNLKLFDEIRDLKHLIASDYSFSSEDNLMYRDNIVDITIEGCEDYSLYVNYIRRSLFEILSVLFAHEIKNNEVVRNIFDAQLIVDIDLRTIELSKSLDNIKIALDTIITEHKNSYKEQIKISKDTYKLVSELHEIFGERKANKIDENKKNSEEALRNKFQVFANQIKTLASESSPNNLKANDDSQKDLLYNSANVNTPESPFDQYELGKAYLSGKGVDCSNESGIKWIRSAAMLGYYDAQCHLAKIYDQGILTDSDIHEAIIWYKKTAEKNNVDAMNRLGEIYRTGNGVRRDTLEAINWFKKAAKIGDVYAMYTLCDIYKNGDGVERDILEAISWYKKVADRGSVAAMFRLGNIFYYGDGVERDILEAINWYKKAVERGDYDAMFHLGNIYRAGDGVERNILGAIKWYKEASERGNDNAMYCLGEIYRDGDGVERDILEAINWFRKATERGHDYAMDSLGDIYRYGDGVERDILGAIKWYKEAAKKGNEFSMDSLGDIYRDGVGVERDIFEALCWYKKAEKLNLSEAKEKIKRIGKNSKIAVKL